MKSQTTNVSIFDVAREILHLSENGMTTRKLQKLAFFCQGFHLAVFDTELFIDDFEAWQFGPVCYRLFKAHQGRYTVAENDIKGDPTKLTAKQKALIKLVFSQLEDLSGDELSELTHVEGTPWWNARKHHNLPVGASSEIIISKDSIKEYFKSLQET